MTGRSPQFQKADVAVSQLTPFLVPFELLGVELARFGARLTPRTRSGTEMLMPWGSPLAWSLYTLARIDRAPTRTAQPVPAQARC